MYSTLVTPLKTMSEIEDRHLSYPNLEHVPRPLSQLTLRMAPRPISRPTFGLSRLPFAIYVYVGTSLASQTNPITFITCLKRCPFCLDFPHTFPLGACGFSHFTHEGVGQTLTEREIQEGKGEKEGVWHTHGCILSPVSVGKTLRFILLVFFSL